MQVAHAIATATDRCEHAHKRNKFTQTYTYSNWVDIIYFYSSLLLWLVFFLFGEIVSGWHKIYNLIYYITTSSTYHTCCICEHLNDRMTCQWDLPSQMNIDQFNVFERMRWSGEKAPSNKHFLYDFNILFIFVYRLLLFLLFSDVLFFRTAFPHVRISFIYIIIVMLFDIRRRW